MIPKPRLIQLGFALAAVVLLALAAFQRPALDRVAESERIVDPGNVVAERHPELNIMTTALGGLRAPVVAALWIRAEQHKDAERYFDAMQLADLICQLQPRSPGVWSYHAWNMAWNISVATHTPEERWLWVTNGLRLLRDRGIPMCPRSLMLYKDLAWIFYSKMGGRTDEMHMYYKKRWADEMQRLLGAPPVGTTDEVIDAFRPVARMAGARLDKDKTRQGREPIQPDQFERLLSERPDTRAYLTELRRRLARAPSDGDTRPRLRRVGDEEPLVVIAEELLLPSYNLFSRDEAVRTWRFAAPDPADAREREIAAWITDKSTADARNALLAFVRAQKLWNVYKMDAEFMLGIMTRWHVPLDWRLCRAHGLYWNSYGLKYCRDVLALADPDWADEDLDTLNTERTLMFCFRDMVFYGKLMYRPDVSHPSDPDRAQLVHRGDWRYIEAGQRQQLDVIERMRKERGESFKDNVYGPGHRNWIVNCIEMLYAGGEKRWPLAKELLAWTIEKYDPPNPEWRDLEPRSDEDLRKFVQYRLLKDGAPIQPVTISQIEASLIAAFEARAAGDERGYEFFLGHARGLYNLYQQDAQSRLRLPPFARFWEETLVHMIAQPAALGAELPIQRRQELYMEFYTAGNAPALYHVIRLFIEPNWESDGWREELRVGFEAAFPPPPDYDEYLRALERRRRAPVTSE